MKGKRSIQWIWDWLGQGSMGEQYEVLPTIQPITIVDGIAYPPEYKCWAQAAQNVVNGTVTTALPVPDADKARLWLQVWVKSTAGTAPQDWIDRSIQGASFAIAAQLSATAALLDYPLIGGALGNSTTAGAITGLGPQLSFAASPLQHRHIDTVAAGTFVIRGKYIDIPLTSPFPARFL